VIQQFLLDERCQHSNISNRVTCSEQNRSNATSQ